MLRGFFIFLMPAVALCLAITMFLFRRLYGIFFAGMMLVLAALATLSLKTSRIRWIFAT
jgi:hypothetical protein